MRGIYRTELLRSGYKGDSYRQSLSQIEGTDSSLPLRMTEEPLRMTGKAAQNDKHVRGYRFGRRTTNMLLMLLPCMSVFCNEEDIPGAARAGQESWRVRWTSICGNGNPMPLVGRIV